MERPTSIPAHKKALDALLLGIPGVTAGKMFGSPAYYAKKRLFACVYGQGVGVKVPEALAKDLLSKRHIIPFQPLGKPKRREWIQINRTRSLDYEKDLDIFHASIDFVSKAEGGGIKAGTLNAPLSIECHPLTRDRWNDFEKLFGREGAYGGCWCMWWRISRMDFERQKGEGNRRAMKQIVESGEVPGILAYHASEPIGWCSVAPREVFHSLNRSPVLRRIDQRQVWSIVCFFIARGYRHQGVTIHLIKAAVDYVRRQGGKVIEAYPTDPRGRRLAPVSSFMGLPSVYKRAGFAECGRPSKSKVIMRYHIK